MALSIRNPHAEQLARELARISGTTMTDAIVGALEDKLHRLEQLPASDSAFAEIMSISRRCAELPTRDDLRGEQIVESGEG